MGVGRGMLQDVTLIYFDALKFHCLLFLYLLVNVKSFSSFLITSRPHSFIHINVSYPLTHFFLSYSFLSSLIFLFSLHTHLLTCSIHQPSFFLITSFQSFLPWTVPSSALLFLPSPSRSFHQPSLFSVITINFIAFMYSTNTPSFFIFHSCHQSNFSIVHLHFLSPRALPLISPYLTLCHLQYT